MKKIALVLVLFALAAGVYAQSKVSLDVHYTLLGELGDPGGLGIGVGFDRGTFDILTGMDFWVEWDADRKDKTSTIGFDHGMYFSIAPKLAVAEKFSLSFPILLKFYRHSITIKEDDPSGKTKTGQNHLRLDIGARACYALSQRWSIYTGFQLNIIEVAGANKTKESGSFGSGSYGDDAFGLYTFRNGSIDLGVKFNF